MLISRHSRSLFSLPSAARIQCFRCAEGTIRSRSCRIRGDTSFAILRAVTSSLIRLQGTRSARGWLNDVIELKETRGIDLFGWCSEAKVSEEAVLFTASLAALISMQPKGANSNNSTSWSWTFSDGQPVTDGDMREGKRCIDQRADGPHLSASVDD